MARRSAQGNERKGYRDTGEMHLDLETLRASRNDFLETAEWLSVVQIVFLCCEANHMIVQRTSSAFPRTSDVGTRDLQKHIASA